MLLDNLELITQDDLENLRSNEITESKTLEYKRDFDISTGDKRKEFLADISAFANSDGGDIIFGISEDKDTGVPKEITGIDIDNNDEFIRRIEDLLRDGVSPRISSPFFKIVKLNNNRSVLIIRVKKSWQSPHRVVFGGHDKFYSRNSKGKYPLDVNELRNAFLFSENIVNKIRMFREERISRLLNNEAPVPYESGAKLVLHIIPISAFSYRNMLNVNDIKDKVENFPILYCGSWNRRINLDGYLLYSYYDKDNKCYSYSQFYKSGIIESVNSSMLISNDEYGKYIPSVLYEQEINNITLKYMMYMKDIQIDTPIIILLSLLNIKDYYMAVNNSWGNRNRIDRDVIMTSEVIIEDYDTEISKALKPLYDEVWNACGLIGSLNYNENGEWIDR